MNKNMKFNEIITALVDGKIARRLSWVDKDEFIFMQIPSEIGKEIVPKMQSLPQSVKDEFNRRFNNEVYQISSIYYCDQLARVNCSNLITSYSPSIPDIFAVDWEIIN